MKATYIILILLGCCLTISCQSKDKVAVNPTVDTPFVWEGANVYFLLTDRFNNGDTTNDLHFNRTKETGILRDFMGGDLTGITQKIEEGYFNELGINAIWFTPVVEQIHGGVDEGTGLTYGYHGYWTKDWTNLDPNFGTMEDLAQLVQTAHENGIRILMDVVLNHTGPTTDKDPFWGDNWARQNPTCTYTSYETTTACTLVENLPDILTEQTEAVELPEFLTTKWKEENRFELEIAELDTFFAQTKLQKTPANYIVKWLTDYVRELGIDGFRVDTAKHVNEDIWKVLKSQATIAFDNYKEDNPERVLDNTPFFMLGEVYNYTVNNGRDYSFGENERVVDYFDYGFDNLINFQFKYDAQGDYESLFQKYDTLVQKTFEGISFMNYATSHDDGSPFDSARKQPFETGTKLLLTPGISQIYYGDETARDLTIEGTEGDATLRSFMNWDQFENPQTQKILSHWQKIGSFRARHPAIGAGKHTMLSQKPYLFKREFRRGSFSETVIVGLDLPYGKKEIVVGEAFANAEQLTDAYSGKTVMVQDGKVVLETPYNIVLLER